MKKNDLYVKALLLWGNEAQVDMIVEECSELIHAIQKLKRNQTVENEVRVCEEMADVRIMIEQGLYVFSRRIFDEKYKEKIKRLSKRVLKAEGNKTKGEGK